MHTDTISRLTATELDPSSMPRLRHTRRIVHLLCVALLAQSGLAACNRGAGRVASLRAAQPQSQTTQAVGAEAVVDPCGLISTARLQDAFGHPYLPGRATHGGRGAMPAFDQCVWTNADSGAHLVSLTVSSGREASGRFRQLRTLAEAPVTLPIGDAAYRHGSNHIVLAGGTIYQLNPVLAQRSETFDAAQAILRELIANR